jgi:hypothetical protein
MGGVRGGVGGLKTNTQCDTITQAQRATLPTLLLLLLL